DWSNDNVTSVLHICWGAQAALYHHYGIGKYELPEKCSGIFTHKIHDATLRLVRGFNDVFHAPHSRYTTVYREEIEKAEDLILVSESEDAGVFIIKSRNGKHVMITGHLEYDATTLKEEYERDIKRGLDVDIPENYFPNDDV